MAEITRLNLNGREEIGKNACKQLRKSGKVPVNLYGHGQTPASLTAAQRELSDVLEVDTQFLEVTIDGKAETALIREVQYDTYGQEVLHVDLLRVDADEAVEVEISITLRGIPKGASEGGVLERFLTHARIKVAPRDVPDAFELNVAELGIHDSIQLKDLVLPPKAELADDPEKAICAVVAKREEPEPAAEGEEPEIAEPEVAGEDAPKKEGDSD